MSTTIYTSEKVIPYVYMGTHKVTGQFYIGSRYGTKSYLIKGFPSHIDLGIHYTTSSKLVKDLGFENFNWIILAEFFNSITQQYDAYLFEQELIGQHINDPLNLNGFCDEKGKWISKRINETDEEKKFRIEKMRITNLNKTPEEKALIALKRSITIQNRTEEEKAASAKKQSEALQRRTEEEKAESIRKMLETNQNKSDEEKLALSKTLSDIHKNRTPEEKEQHAKAKSEAHRNKSDEEKRLIVIKRNETLQNKTPEEKENLSRKLSTIIQNRTEEEKAESIRKMLETNQNKSDEEKNIILEKLNKLSYEMRIAVVLKRNYGTSYTDIWKWILSQNIKISYSALPQIYKRNKHLVEIE